MRKLPALLVVALLVGGAVPATAAEIAGPAAIVSRALDLVKSWLKAGADLDPNGFAISDLPASSAGADLDPNGIKAGADLDPNGLPVNHEGAVVEPQG